MDGISNTYSFLSSYRMTPDLRTSPSISMSNLKELGEMNN